jgi:hypothetical protein
MCVSARPFVNFRLRFTIVNPTRPKKADVIGLQKNSEILIYKNIPNNIDKTALIVYNLIIHQTFLHLASVLRGASMPIKGGTMAPKTSTAKSDIKDYPFLVKTLVTYTKANAQGIEERHKDEVVFKLDRPSARMPWYVLRNYSVPKYLTKTYGPMEVAWQRIYEIKIVKLINRADPNDITDIPLRVMTLGQLESYVTRWELNVPVTEFFSVEKAREMVALRQQDEKGYERHLAEYREGKQRSYPELDNMRGDGEAATAEEGEFDALDKKTPVKAKMKPVPATVAEPSAEEAKALDTPPDIGEQPPASGNPFAGV